MFEERFIAYVDILGFKEIVKKAKGNDEYQKSISKVLNYIANIRTDNYHGEWAKYGITNDVAVFSDSIIVSYPCDRSSHGDGLYNLLMDLVHLCIVLIRNGIFVRGGITVGDVIHDQNICWGPALIDAYELEEENAVFPRIIIDKKAIARGKELYAKYNPSPYEKDGDDLNQLILLDEDGAYYLDYLSQWDEFDYVDDYNNWLDHIRVDVEENWKNAVCPRIKMKYVWYAHYYNNTVNKLNGICQCKLIDLKKLSSS